MSTQCYKEFADSVSGTTGEGFISLSRRAVSTEAGDGDTETGEGWIGRDETRRLV